MKRPPASRGSSVESLGSEEGGAAESLLLLQGNSESLGVLQSSIRSSKDLLIFIFPVSANGVLCCSLFSGT